MPAITVVTIARDLRRLRRIPATPDTRAPGNDKATISSARALRAPPHPGLHRKARTSVAPPVTSRLADILPKRIFFFY